MVDGIVKLYGNFRKIESVRAYTLDEMTIEISYALLVIPEV